MKKIQRVVVSKRAICSEVWLEDTWRNWSQMGYLIPNHRCWRLSQDAKDDSFRQDIEICIVLEELHSVQRDDLVLRLLNPIKEIRGKI